MELKVDRETVAQIVATMYPEVAGYRVGMVATTFAGWDAPHGHVFVAMVQHGGVAATLLTVPQNVFNTEMRNPQNRLDPAMAERHIAKETYTLLPSGKCLVCELTLSNGYVCTGKSSLIDPANFVFALAKASARKRAMEELFTILGYAKQDIVHKH